MFFTAFYTTANYFGTSAADVSFSITQYINIIFYIYTYIHTHVHKPQRRRLAAAVCEVETMCFHNLSKPVAVHKTPESIFSPPFAHGPVQKACKSIAVWIPSPQSTVKSATDTLILEDRQPQVCARSWKQQGKKRPQRERDHIYPADKLCNRQTTVSRPEESNLKGISGRMSTEQVDHDVTWWISGETRSKDVRGCHVSDSNLYCSRDAWRTLTRIQTHQRLHMKPHANAMNAHFLQIDIMSILQTITYVHFQTNLSTITQAK